MASGTRRSPFYDKTIGRVTGFFDHATDWLADALPGHPAAGRCSTGSPRSALAAVIFVASLFMVPLLGTEFVPEGRLLGDHGQLLHPGRLVARSHRGQGAPGRSHHPRISRGELHAGDAQHRPMRWARTTPASTCAWSTATSASAAWTRCPRCCASGCAQVPGITVTHVGLLDPVGGQKQIEFSLQGPDLRELDRLTRLVMDKVRPIAGPGGPRLQHQGRQADH